MTGSNTYTGGTVINSGTLSINDNPALGGGGAGVTFNGGTLRILGSFNSQRTFTLTPAGGTINTNGSDLTYDGFMSGSGPLTKIGGGSLILRGTSSNYNGGTTINQGTVSVSANANLGDANGSITFNGGSLIVSSGQDTFTHPVVLNSTGTINNESGIHPTFSRNFSGGGGLTKTGAGTLTLQGTNTFTGETNISAGTLRIGAPGGGAGTSLALQNSTLNYTAAGGVLDFGNVTGAVLGGLKGGQNVSLINANNLPIALTEGTGGATGLTYSGILSGTGSLTKSGSGTWTLSGANTFSGITQITGGQLILNNSKALQSSDLDYNSYGGSLSFGSLNAAELGGLRGNQNLSIQSVALTTAGMVNATIPYSGALSGTGSLTKDHSGTLILSGASTYSGGTTMNAGTLVLGSNSCLGTGQVAFIGGTLQTSSSISLGNTIQLNATDLKFDTNGSNPTFSGDFIGPGDFQKIGAGTLTLTGTSTYQLSGGAKTITNIVTGFLQGNTNNLKRTIDVHGGAGVIFNQQSNGTFSTGTDGEIRNNGSLTKTGPATLTLSENGTYSDFGGIVIINQGTLSVNLDRELGGSSGSLTFGGGTLLVTAAPSGQPNFTSAVDRLGRGGGTISDDSGAPASFSGVISGSGGLMKGGAGTVTLQTANTFTGDTRILGGILRLGDPAALAEQHAEYVWRRSRIVELRQYHGGHAGRFGRHARHHFAKRQFAGRGANHRQQRRQRKRLRRRARRYGLAHQMGGGTQSLSGANIFTGTTKITGSQLILNNQNALQSSTLDYGSYGGSLQFGAPTAYTLGGLVGQPEFAIGECQQSGRGFVVWQQQRRPHGLLRRAERQFARGFGRQSRNRNRAVSLARIVMSVEPPSAAARCASPPIPT